MHISGNAPSSVILGQTKQFEKLKTLVRKYQKQAEAKMDGVINNKITISININTEKFWCSQNATNQSKSTVELGYMCPHGLTGSPAVTLTK